MSHPRHTMPTPAGDFIGRERDVTELCRMLDSSRMISLTGTGGIGKTRLALRVAERAAPSLAGGARFVDLSDATSLGKVLRTVTHAVGVAEDHDGPLTDVLVTALRPLNMLLLLDTCERAAEPVAWLCRTLLDSCPGLRIMTTSRQPLQVSGETVWRVPPLALPARGRHGTSWTSLTFPETLDYEAVRLFVARARAARPGFEPDRESTARIVEICWMLDGVPLAIELAAARIRVLSVQQILRRLDDRFRLLTSGGHELPTRQRTMRAVVDWSHDLLSADEQTLLRRLSVFCSWPLELAGTVCALDGLTPEAVPALHASLLDKSLVMVDCELDGETYYRLPDTVRVYAAERLAAADEEERVWDRYLVEVLARLERMNGRVSGPLGWPERLRTLRRLDHNRDCFDRLLTWSLDRGHVAEGLRVCVALRPYWYVRDLPSVGSHYLRRLLDAAPALPDRALRARGLAVFAELCLESEGMHTSVTAAREGLAGARSCGDRHAEAIALAALATVAVRAGDDAGARRQAEEALVAAEATKDSATQVLALGILVRCARRQDDDATAGDLLTRSMEIADRLGDRWVVARCLTAFGELSARRGELDTAVGQLEQALRIFSEMGTAPETARCARSMGRLDLARGDVSGARRRFSDAMRASVATGRRETVALALEGMAELAVAEEQHERAASLAGAAAALHSALSRPAPGAEALFARVKRELSADAAEKAWQAWRDLPLEQVVDRALCFPVPRRALPSLLTRREREVAALVGAGLSNREIANRLTISQATAARHIANIFRKLLFTSRTQLADWARRHGLEP